jgi:hypothetical protein
LKNLFNPTYIGLWSCKYAFTFFLLTIWLKILYLLAEYWTSKFDEWVGGQRFFQHHWWFCRLGTLLIISALYCSVFYVQSTDSWPNAVMFRLLHAYFCRIRNVFQNLWTNSTCKFLLGSIFQIMMLFVELWSDLFRQHVLCCKWFVKLN